MNIIASRAVGFALFGGLAAFLAFGPASAHVQILALLLGWASYSHFDGKLDGLKRAVIHGLGGALLGIASGELYRSTFTLRHAGRFSDLGGARRRDHARAARHRNQNSAAWRRRGFTVGLRGGHRDGVAERRPRCDFGSFAGKSRDRRRRLADCRGPVRLWRGLCRRCIGQIALAGRQGYGGRAGVRFFVDQSNPLAELAPSF